MPLKDTIDFAEQVYMTRKDVKSCLEDVLVEGANVKFDEWMYTNLVNNEGRKIEVSFDASMKCSKGYVREVSVTVKDKREEGDGELSFDSFDEDFEECVRESGDKLIRCGVPMVDKLEN